MNKKRIAFIYDLFGKIENTKKCKPKNVEKTSSFYHKLKVNLENKNHIKSIYVFPNRLTNQEIWQDIEQTNYQGKKYHFQCRNHMGYYYLIDWQELKNHGSN